MAIPTPIASWSPTLDDAGNDTGTLNDLIGSNDGSIAGPTWVPDIDNGGVRKLEFAGGSDAVNLTPLSLNFAQDTSWSTWFRAVNAGNSILISVSDQTSQNDRFSLHVTSSNLRTVIFEGGTSYPVHYYELGIESGNVWRHAVATWNGTTKTIRLYLDGVEVSTGTLIAESDAATLFKFGNNQWSNRAYIGGLDSINHWDQELTPAEVSELYTAGRAYDPRSAPAPPVNTVPPSIAGTPEVGQQLTCTPGTWNPAGDSYTYQWYRADDDQGTGENPIAGATGLTYTLQAGDEGFFIRCTETATNAGGSDTADSNYLGPVTPAPPPFMPAWAQRTTHMIG